MSDKKIQPTSPDAAVTSDDEATAEAKGPHETRRISRLASFFRF
ncbi:MAG TPA: hypothetical protein VND23_09435 [Acidimicrobiales bacterium]|nr:hypothetical protein [Acidimicrobiales bacterium]